SRVRYIYVTHAMFDARFRHDSLHFARDIYKLRTAIRSHTKNLNLCHRRRIVARDLSAESKELERENASRGTFQRNAFAARRACSCPNAPGASANKAPAIAASCSDRANSKETLHAPRVHEISGPVPIPLFGVAFPFDMKFCAEPFLLSTSTRGRFVRPGLP